MEYDDYDGDDDEWNRQIDQYNEAVILAVIKGEITFGWGATEMQGVDPVGWSDTCDQDDANVNFLDECIATYCSVHKLKIAA